MYVVSISIELQNTFQQSDLNVILSEIKDGGLRGEAEASW